MKASLFIAAAAHAVNGELHALRIGLPVVVPGQPFAVGALIEVPYLEAIDDHSFKVELVDEYGEPFEVEGPDGQKHRVVIEGTGGTGIPPKHRVGSPRIVTIGGNLVLPLAFGMRYEFRLSIDGKQNDAWVVGFDTPPTPMAEAA